MALMVPKVSIGANGRAMPVIGMGTASLSPEAMLEAIRIGYRHFDTAFVYGSETRSSLLAKQLPKPCT